MYSSNYEKNHVLTFRKPSPTSYDISSIFPFLFFVPLRFENKYLKNTHPCLLKMSLTLHKRKYNYTPQIWSNWTGQILYKKLKKIMPCKINKKFKSKWKIWMYQCIRMFWPRIYIIIRTWFVCLHYPSWLSLGILALWSRNGFDIW